MGGEVDYGPFLKALSGADPIQARRFAAAKALEIGWGGVSKVSAITGFSRNTINKGIQELESNEELKGSSLFPVGNFRISIRNS